jgi:hypothetical protein
MALFCKKNMTPLQRSSFRWMGAALLLAVFANFLTPLRPDSVVYSVPLLSDLAVAPGHAEFWKVIVVAALQLLPVLLAVAVAAHYLAHEPDEFIRAMVMRALLWGIACTMAADAIAGVAMMTSGNPFPIGLVNADVLFVSTMVSFRVSAWRFSR